MDRKKAAFVAAGVALAALGFAAVMDVFGPSTGDESAVRPLLTDGDSYSPTEEANIGGREGGDPGLHATAGTLGAATVPTEAPVSPMFGAGAFEQQMLLFEEFGTRRIDSTPASSIEFPRPSAGPAPEQDLDVAASGPSGAELDTWIQEGLYHAPSEYSNDTDGNPWQADVEGFLGRDLDTPPAEGRPPGKAWAHQRWNEFPPQVFAKTVQAGARTNHGARDFLQRHHYSSGEFGPGGLYHTVYKTDLDGGPVITGTTAGIAPQFHPNFPVQDHKSVWTWDGTVPPKLLVGRYGEGMLLRHYNALPIDPSANRGFGLHTISTHEHNGHNPAESDGFTNAFFFPGQYWDYRWPMQLAGYDTVNTSATEPRASFPCEPGETLFVNDSVTGTTKSCTNGRIQLRGDWRETMSTHWFHDHMLDYTAQNVYKGNAAMYNYYSALDRGNETVNDGVNLRLPSGSALSWGNRDYDVNLVIADKAWDAEGQLWFNIFNTDGFLGDRVLTNFLYKPFFEVRARKYRFRILNGAVSRYFQIALVKEVQGSGGVYPGPAGSGISYDPVPFHMVGNDGNLMEHTVPFDGTLDLDGDGDLEEHNGVLPVQAIAERYDIVVDFSQVGPGQKLYFVNLLEHTTGRRPNRKIALADVLSEAYHPVDNGQQWTAGDPAVGPFLQFRTVAMAPGAVDVSMDPNAYEPNLQSMIPLAIDRNDTTKLASARHRTFGFGRSGGGTDSTPWTIKTDGGPGLTADPRRVSAAPQLATGPTEAGFNGLNANGYDNIGTMEVWSLDNGGGWSHPIHIHFEEGVILSRDGNPPPQWEMWARKDVYRLGSENDSSNTIEVALRFREFAGTFVEHCHNTQHEDHAMLLRWDIEHPGQVMLLASPMPTWDGVEYVDTHALPMFRSGDGYGPRPMQNDLAGNQVNVALELPAGTNVADVTVAASRSVVINDRGTVSGLITSSQTATVRNDANVGDLRTYGMVTIGDRAKTGKITTASTVTLGSKAKTGTILQKQVMLPPDDTELKFLKPDASQGSNTVNPDLSIKLLPGRYDDVTVNSGAVLKLVSGTYFFENFTLHTDGMVKYQDDAGPVALVVSDSWTSRGTWKDCDSTWGACTAAAASAKLPAAALPGVTSSLLAVFTGAGVMTFEAPFDGFAIAPNATIRLAGNKLTYKGAYFADTFELMAGNKLNASSFDPLVFVPPIIPPLEADAAPIIDDGEYVKDPDALVALGKALFWDVNLGVDSQACASCHFSAGADLRVKNQVNPGLLDQSTPVAFETFATGGGGSNYTMHPDDFPLRKYDDPADRESSAFDPGNDVISSAGTFRGDITTDGADGLEVCNIVDDAVFHVGELNARRVAPRNAPTTINAVFNNRSFWDGRANNHFNGMNPFGLRDTSMGILKDVNGTLTPVLVDIADASLASQAVGPPLSHLEMNCGTGDASFSLLARRVLDLQALRDQEVRADDSVLGTYADGGSGLTLTYREMIADAFVDAYWDSAALTADGDELVENNFSLFFGLAIQAYEATLISDQSEFDAFARNQRTMAGPERRGFDLFVGKAGCVACHVGPTLSGAAIPALIPREERSGVIERMPVATGTAVYDRGFYNIGVTPTSEDLGVGSFDPFGNPLSFTRQVKEANEIDTFSFDPSGFLVNPGTPIDPTERDSIDGSFKVPSLRNVALTGPYFHNGGQATLRQVVEFYNRGGDRVTNGSDACDSSGFGENCSNLDLGILPLHLTDQEVDDIVRFLETLTDPRVEEESAPFDHPALPLSVGHAGDHLASLDDGLGQCDDDFVVLPAVGASGRTLQGLPLLPTFEEMLHCVSGDPTLSPACFDSLYRTGLEIVVPEAPEPVGAEAPEAAAAEAAGAEAG